MRTREDIVTAPEGLENRLFDPGLTDEENRFIAGQTDLLDGVVPPELRVYPTLKGATTKASIGRELDEYEDYFAYPFMPRAVLRDVVQTEAIEAGEWLLARGYRMTESAVVSDVQTKWTIGAIAMTELTSGRGLIKNILSNTTVIGPYMQVDQAETCYQYKRNGIGVWVSEQRRKTMQLH